MTMTDLGPGISGRGVGADLFNANPQSQQFVAMISALYKSLSPLYDPDNAALQDPNWWAKARRNDRLSAFIDMRLAKVARSSWLMEAASDKPHDAALAATVEQALRKVPMFTSSRRHGAKSAFWGRSCLWIEGKRDWAMMGTAPGFELGYLAEWWLPTLLRPLDKRQVIYRPSKVKRPDGREVAGVETLLGTIDAGRHEPMEHPECLMTCVHDDEVERLGYGRGKGEAIAKTLWLIGVIERVGVSGLEFLAHGVVVARLDANARAGTSTDTETLATDTLASIRAMRADGAIVLDSRDEVDVKTMQGGGDQACRAWLEFLYDGLQLMCVGALRPMGGGSGGARAQAETEADSSDDLLDAERELLDEAINRTVVKLFLDLNGGILAAMGLGGAGEPRFRSLRTDHEDPEKVGRILKAAQEVGMSIGADDARRRMGVKKPAPDEETLEAPKPESPFGAPGADPFGGPPSLDEGGKFGDPKPMEKDGGKLRARLRAALAALRG